MNPNLLHTVLDELSLLCYHNYGIWTTYRNIAVANIYILGLTIKKNTKSLNEYSEGERPSEGVRVFSCG